MPIQRPPPAGPRNLREMFYYVWTWMNSTTDDTNDHINDTDNPHSVQHIQLLGVTENQHHNKVHNLYGPDQGDVDSTGSPVLRDGLFYNGTKFALDRRTRYIKEGFVQGAAYQIGDEVSNGSQISEAIIDGAIESPFVSPIGEPSEVYGGTMATLADPAAKFIEFGNRYTFTEGGYITSYRIYTYASQTYNTFLVVDPLGDKIITQIGNFTAIQSGWRDVAIQAVLVPPNVTFDLSARTSGTANPPIAALGDYNYLTPQNLAVPAPGEISHGRSTPDIMRVSYEDFLGGDRTALIQNMSLGDSIEDGSGIVWSVQSNIDGVPITGYGQLTVSPAVTGSAGTREFTFNTTVPAPVDVGQDLNWWLGNSPTDGTIQGLYGSDILYGDIVPDDSAYGTDITVQEAYIPTEWAVKVLSEGGAIGEGGGFTPSLFSGAGTTGYVPDPGTEQGWVLSDDSSWVPQAAGGGLSIDIDGGSPSDIYSLGQHIEGGSPDSVYLPSQIIDGGAP
jgi:hypothetical protein